MDHREKLALVKNAIANVLRGGAGAIVAIALPPFLTRSMTPESFGAWCLVLQIAAYVGYLDFGIQTAVGRFVAYTTERRDWEHRRELINAAWSALIVCGLVAMACMGAVSLLLSSIFRGMNPSLVPDVRSAILLVGGSLALGLPASIFSGIFVGLQRNEIPAAVTGATKLLAAFFLVIAARRGGSLTAMAATWALVHLAGYCAQYLACRRLVPEITPRLFASGAAFRELLSFVASLSVWNFAMLIIGGLDVTLVAMIDYPRVPFYAVATTAVTFFIGFHGAILNALLPSAAVMHAREGAQRLGELVISTTRATTALLLFTGLPFIALAGSLLTVWVGPQYARESRLLLQLLLVANIIRLSAGAYSTALLAAGEHRRVILSPILEAGVNLLVSVLAGLWLGAVGVAIGTLAGAIVSVAAHWFYNMPRTRSIAIRTGSYVLEGLVKPFVYLAPLLLLFLISNAGFTSVAVALWTATILLATTPLLLICVVGKSRTRSLLHLISASRPVESR